jgi:predicted ferric reductase
MWTIAASEVQRGRRSTATPLFVAALNDVIDISLMQRAAQRAHVPDLIVYILIVLVLIAGTLFGTTWKTWRSTLLAAIALAVMFGAVFGAVIDLDQPQTGTIRVDLSALASDKDLFAQTK